MKSYDIISSKSTLKISRKKSLVVFQLMFLCFFTWPMFAVPIANILIYHANFLLSVILIVFVDLPLLFVFLAGGVYLRNKVIILDKSLNQVIVNRRCLCTLTELKAVSLGSYIVPTARDQPLTRSGLYLTTSMGTALEIERAVLLGPSRNALKEVGLAIADFLSISSNIS